MERPQDVRELGALQRLYVLLAAFFGNHVQGTEPAAFFGRDVGQLTQGDE